MRTKLTDRQYRILTLISDRTQWEGDERPGTKLTLYFAPLSRGEWSDTLSQVVILDPQMLTNTLKAFVQRGYIRWIPDSPLAQACAITEDGLLALAQHAEQNDDRA